MITVDTKAELDGMDMKDRLHLQSRRQAIWAIVWMFLSIGAMFVRPSRVSPTQWLFDQGIMIFGMLMLFQLGRVFQGLLIVRSYLASIQPSRPEPWTSIDELSIDRSSTDKLSNEWVIAEVRAYSSMEDANRHGWEFSEPMAHFGGLPVPKYASYRNAVYRYDGLTPEQMSGTVPSDKRVFGRLMYRLLASGNVPPGGSSPMPMPSR